VRPLKRNVRRHTTLPTLLRAALLGVPAAFLAYGVVVGIRSGTLWMRDGPIHRRKHPLWFWAVAALFLIMAGVFAAFALRVVLGTVVH
jgi:hypothetical protein